MTPAQTRARLLDAATAVIGRGGPSALTLDAVAAEAAVDKDEIIEHFDSRDALMTALVGAWLDGLEADAHLFATDGDRWGLGYVLATESADRTPTEHLAHVALLAALAADPDRLAVVRQRWGQWQAELVEVAPDPVIGTVIRLAADGLWLADLLGLAPPSGELRRQVVSRLIELSDTADPVRSARG